MSKIYKIEEFLETNDDEIISEYSNRLYESLKDLNVKEEKHGLWFVLLIFLYILSSSSHLNEVNIGVITIKDISVISKLLPLVSTYVVFNMHLITSHKKELMLALNVISEKRFNQLPLNFGRGEFSRRFIIKLFFPYSFSNAISKLTTNKPNNIEAILGFLLLLPVLIIGMVPYIVLVLMLIDVYNKYTNDTLGWICFCGTIWGLLLLFFLMYINAKNDIE